MVAYKLPGMDLPVDLTINIGGSRFESCMGSFLLTTSIEQGVKIFITVVNQPKLWLFMAHFLFHKSFFKIKIGLSIACQLDFKTKTKQNPESM